MKQQRESGRRKFWLLPLFVCFFESARPDSTPLLNTKSSNRIKHQLPLEACHISVSVCVSMTCSVFATSHFLAVGDSIRLATATPIPARRSLIILSEEFNQRTKFLLISKTYQHLKLNKKTSEKTTEELRVQHQYKEKQERPGICSSFRLFSFVLARTGTLPHSLHQAAVMAWKLLIKAFLFINALHSCLAQP